MRNNAVRLPYTPSLVVFVGAREDLQPKARTLLAQADARLDAQDHAGALDAYIEAVKADRAAADLKTIRLYAPPPFSLAPPPPPGSPAIVMNAPAPARADAVSSLVAALRQFLEIHPGHADAERLLVLALPDAEAIALANELLEKRTGDAQLYHLRAQVRFRAGQWLAGLADLEHEMTLEPSNAELFYATGFALYEIAAENDDVPAHQRRELIRRGLAALERAQSLRAEHFGSLACRYLLLREQAKLETDPAVREQQIEEADAARQRALEIMRARRGEARADADRPPLPACAARRSPFRVDGDLKAPVVRERVEPVIPEEARKAWMAGIVIIEVEIDKEGTVQDARVLKPLPFGIDAAALEAVKQWTFEPGTLDGQPVDLTVNLIVNVRLDGGAPASP